MTTAPAQLQAIHPVLAAHDVTVSSQFFVELGFALLFQDQPQAPKYAVLARDAAQLHLQWADPSQWAYPTDRPIYRFYVNDVDALFREFAARGHGVGESGRGSPWAVPADTPWGTREFHLRDPGANGLHFYSML